MKSSLEDGHSFEKRKRRTTGKIGIAFAILSLFGYVAERFFDDRNLHDREKASSYKETSANKIAETNSSHKAPLP